ncbi:Pre-C2HC domain,Zinc finger, CCHC-type, partial [Cinara cedri]
MNNKSPLSRKTDKQKPLVPPITIINQNSILSKDGSPSTTPTPSDDDNIFPSYTTDSYRKTLKFLKEKKVNFHTNQLKGDKSYRVVIRHLHHSTPVDTIKEELNSKGFTVRNIINVLHYQTKKPLPIFFVDLEPSPSNKDIFTIDTLVYTKIKIEEPRSRRNLIQCTRCQSYGHTQAYCNHQPRCVKCGDNHLSSECKKVKDSPATCALCTQPHPANYRGCQVHKILQKYNRNSAPKSTLRDQNSKPNFFSTLSSSKDSPQQVVSSQINSSGKPSYAHTTSKRNTTLILDNHDST